MLCIDSIIAQSYGLLKRDDIVCATKAVYHHLDIANQMTKIDIRKWQKG